MIRPACRWFALIAGLAVTSRAGESQTNTGIAAVDSASAARGAWARAVGELGRHDTAAARHDITRAAAAWPIQPTYVWASAVLSARTGNVRDAIAALNQYADLGLGRDLDADSTFRSLRTVPGFAEVHARHDASRQPIVRGRRWAALQDSTFWPEGMDVDPRSGRVYVASVRHRTVAVIEANGSTRELWPRDRADLSAVLGVRIDTIRNALWVTTSPVRSSPDFSRGDTSGAALLRVRPSDGVIERRWTLPPISGDHALGDLAVGPRGDIFVTDSNDPVLYRLRPGADTLEAVRDARFRSLQGLAPSPDGRFLFLADYSHGLLRVDLERGSVIRLDDAPRSTSLGCDGIAWDRGAIVAVQNGVVPARVMRFSLDATWTRIARADVLEQDWRVADEPTIGAVMGEWFVYVANSQWEKFDAAGRRVAAKPLTAPTLLAVPLP
jgi:sugar lactone lactonase YvrE